ncbi:MAG: DUF4357 domain-containing protein [Chloroflexi bacterium]|nr:DUF4357 domain-containing protein [Chloroflexota bacterium]
MHAYLRTARKELVSKGVLVPDRLGLVFTQDYILPSPSTAAGVILGRAANGRTEWKTMSGQTLRTIQEAAITSS